MNLTYDNLLETIDCRWNEMQDLESFIETIRMYDKYTYSEALSPIKVYIQNHRAELFYKGYTDEDYIFEFFKDLVKKAFEYEHLEDLTKYTVVWYKLFKNQY